MNHRFFYIPILQNSLSLRHGLLLIDGTCSSLTASSSSSEHPVSHRFDVSPVPLNAPTPITITMSQSLARSSVTSCNTHATLLTNLSQFQILSYLSHPHHTHIKFHIGIHQILNMLSHVLPTSIYLNPSLSSCFTFLSSPKLLSVIGPLLFLVPDYCINNFIQEYPYVSCCVNCVLVLVVS